MVNDFKIFLLLDNQKKAVSGAYSNKSDLYDCIVGFQDF